MLRESRARSILKAVSYRLAGTALTAAIAFALTRKAGVSLAIGGLEALVKVALYYFHERLWHRIPFGRHPVKPAVVWLTGLSGSGKSTLADGLAEALRRRGLKVERLDGDKLRKLFPETGFTREARENHVRRAGALASYLEANGIIVIASLISPYEESRRHVRGLCRNFLEVHVATPLQACEERDTKGLYARARRGELKNFTGIDDPYEPPAKPDLAVDTSRQTLEESLRLLLEAVEKRLE